MASKKVENKDVKSVYYWAALVAACCVCAIVVIAWWSFPRSPHEASTAICFLTIVLIVTGSFTVLYYVLSIYLEDVKEEKQYFQKEAAVHEFLDYLERNKTLTVEDVGKILVAAKQQLPDAPYRNQYYPHFLRFYMQRNVGIKVSGNELVVNYGNYVLKVKVERLVHVGEFSVMGLAFNCNHSDNYESGGFFINQDGVRLKPYNVLDRDDSSRLGEKTEMINGETCRVFYVFPSPLLEEMTNGIFNFNDHLIQFTFEK